MASYWTSRGFSDPRGTLLVCLQRATRDSYSAMILPDEERVMKRERENINVRNKYRQVDGSWSSHLGLPPVPPDPACCASSATHPPARPPSRRLPSMPVGAVCIVVGGPSASGRFPSRCRLYFTQHFVGTPERKPLFIELGRYWIDTGSILVLVEFYRVTRDSLSYVVHSDRVFIWWPRSKRCPWLYFRLDRSQLNLSIIARC